MYEKIAWSNFLNTGDLESYLEYKRLLEVKSNLEVNSLGENLYEINKDEGDSNKGSSI